MIFNQPTSNSSDLKLLHNRRSTHDKVYFFAQQCPRDHRQKPLWSRIANCHAKHDVTHVLVNGFLATS